MTTITTKQITGPDQDGYVWLELEIDGTQSTVNLGDDPRNIEEVFSQWCASREGED